MFGDLWKALVKLIDKSFGIVVSFYFADKPVIDRDRLIVGSAFRIGISRDVLILGDVFKDVPANSGVLQPIDFVIPEGSLLNVHAPKPVGGYTETILRIIDVVFVALSQAAPDMVNGCAYGTINALSLSGHRQNGQRWVMFSFFGGGHGGHPEGDGLNHGNAPISTATIPPLEILEAAYPVRFTQWALRTDSGGPGRQRGGCGAVYEISLLEEKADGFLFGERGKYAPPGVLGGEHGTRNRFTFEENGQRLEPPMVSKMVGIQMKKGESVRLETPGGGGYGHAFERDPQLIAEDVRLGYVSVEAAKDQFGCIVDASGKLDKTATETRRTEAGR